MQNKITHFELPCTDMDRAGSFYEEIFGWVISAIPDMDYRMVQTVETDEQQRPKEAGAINGGFYTRSEHVSPSPVLVIEVDNIEEYTAAINGSGGAALGPVQQVGDMGRYVQFSDTEGNVLALWQSLH